MTTSRGIGRGTRRRYAHLSPAERILERFVRQIEWDETGCWPFKGTAVKGDYRHFKVADKQILAHRWSYEYFKGPIPVGLTIDHLCRRPRCVNPDHLEAVTIRQNIRRGNGLAGQNARKQVAKCGHPFDFVEPDGRRRCLRCYKAQLRESARRKRRDKTRTPVSS